jgi:hypothetical protein
MNNFEFLVDSERESELDWVEDFNHENGRYMCKCVSCGNTFLGHKRRQFCKVCSKEKSLLIYDKYENLLEEGSIFDIHQTVNGQSLFIVFKDRKSVV